MARFLRDTYPNGFRSLIFGRCKSAGTLLALGSTEIVMGARGELGPLDIQVSEKDEPFRVGSGLELFTALNSITQNTFMTFEHYLLGLIQRSGSQISMKTAAKIATELTIGIMSPISQQIDPLQLGRRERALNIVKAYAHRLNISEKIVAELATGYPDHGFVIDCQEAKTLLGNGIVRVPDEQERELEEALAASDIAGLYSPYHYHYPDVGIVLRLNSSLDALPEEELEATDEEHDDHGDVRGSQKKERSEVDGERSPDGTKNDPADGAK